MGNIGYKLFKVYCSEERKGKLYPLYVNASCPVHINKWTDAVEGERTVNGKVKSRLGELAYRPGWHLNDVAPYEIHIGKKNENGNICWLPENLVWAEVEYSSDIDYQREANNNGTNKKGILIEKNAQLNHIPTHGCYRYKTSPNMYGSWIIAGSIKVNRILSDEEVIILCNKHGLSPLPRWNGKFNNEKYHLEIA